MRQRLLRVLREDLPKPETDSTVCVADHVAPQGPGVALAVIRPSLAVVGCALQTYIYTWHTLGLRAPPGPKANVQSAA